MLIESKKYQDQKIIFTYAENIKKMGSLQLCFNINTIYLDPSHKHEIIVVFILKTAIEV